MLVVRVSGAARPPGTGSGPLPGGKPRRKDVVSRSKSWIAAIAIILVSAVCMGVAPERVAATPLKAKLRVAKRALRQSTIRLKSAEDALAAALAMPAPPLTDVTAAPRLVASPSAGNGEASPTPTATAAATLAGGTIDELRARVARARKAVRRWQRRVRRLQKRYRLQLNLARWERSGRWRPIIKVAAAKYRVSADGIYRLMMSESGGDRYAGSTFKGLFQYHPTTWSASWNPWRRDSIYDASSQIFATCYAVRRGMGPSMWRNTYWAAF